LIKFHTVKKFILLGLGVFIYVLFFLDSNPNFNKIDKLRLELDKSISENMHPVYAPLIFWGVLFIGVAIYVINDQKRNK